MCHQQKCIFVTRTFCLTHPDLKICLERLIHSLHLYLHIYKIGKKLYPVKSNLPDNFYIQVLCFHFLHLTKNFLCFLVKISIEEDGNMLMLINNMDKLLSTDIIDDSIWSLCNRRLDLSYFLFSCILL